MKLHLHRFAVLIAGLMLATNAAATSPCGQQSACPQIELEGPIPNPWPVDDPNANANLPTLDPDGPSGPYIEEEFFISSTANVFNYNQPDANRGDYPGQNLVVRHNDLEYKTRIIVKRPANPQKFNGTVVIEAMNSTSGFETQPAWINSSGYFQRRGIVVVEVTTSGNQGIPYLTGGCGQFNPSCGSRYESLSIPDNGQEYEIVNQLVTALKSTTSGQRPLPDEFASVKRVFYTGYSQQGGSIVTHASQFHFDGIDGYFVQAASRARTISGNRNEAEYCGGEGAAEYPDCVAGLADDQRLVRTDLPVPVYHGMSETDSVLLGGIARRQDDTDTNDYASYRLIEIPGTAHTAVADTTILPGVQLKDLCKNDVYTFVDGPVFGYQVFDAYWHAMRQQVERGVLPPYAPRIATDENGEVLRDGLRNALGGVRLPEFEYPRYSYFSPTNTGVPFCELEDVEGCVDLPAALAFIGDLACRLIGSAEALPPEVLAELYPSTGRYIRGVSNQTLWLAKNRFLLREDARKRLVEAIRYRR